MHMRVRQLPRYAPLRSLFRAVRHSAGVAAVLAFFHSSSGLFCTRRLCGRLWRRLVRLRVDRCRIRSSVIGVGRLKF